jgi:hypothetical protein
MNSIYQHPKPVFLKYSFAFIVLFMGTAFFAGLSAQAIVGKWKGVSVKNYYSADYAKQSGKSMEEMTAKEIGNSTLEFKADHSFIMTFAAAGNPTVISMTGAWQLTGSSLQLTLEPKYNPKKSTTNATVSITGNTMITTAVIAAPSRIIKTISTSTRI